MISVIQRVSHAEVTVNGDTLGKIQQGIVALVAIEKTDSENDVKQLIERILRYRVFADTNDKMNLSLRDINGGLLLVPQFTLSADTQKGNRPSFSAAATPTEARPLFELSVAYAKQQYPNVACGLFGADMQVSLCNNGPVTFTLRSPAKNH
ncbi:MAG: D-tyrosyl-tRNA(Tyr) deacylase [Cycloclasticus sp.]|nr:D-tyrosyl-tRNA(Tyr) deacylase [Cycloclasticus sp.]MBQ0789241.1 D-tyrosyl-tRNA(Tyr) deacylase [Cycloclasticus sp.]